MAKWLKCSTVDQKSQVRIPPVAPQVKCFLYPSIPFGDQPLVLKRQGGSFALEIVACCPGQRNVIHALPKQNSFSFI